MTKIQMTKTWIHQRQNYLKRSLENWNIQILNLPFDLAQGGEPVEPFRISIFEFRIYFCFTSIMWAKAEINKQPYM